MQLIDALNLSDRELLARTLMAEAGNGSINDMLPVGNVIMNRARQGGTLQDVILAPAQFSPWNTTKMPDGSMLYAAGKGQGRDMGGIKPSNSAYEVADLLLSGEAADVTEGATHFFNPSISKPSWAKGMAGTKIGSHLFGSAGGFRTGAPKIQTQQPLSATSGIGGGSLLSKEPEMSMNPNTPPRSGLLGFMDIMRQQDPETGMTAMERFGAALDPLVRPNERMGEQFRASGARRLQTQSKNKTIETLRQRAQAGDQLAMMVLQGLESGAYDAKTAMSLYMGKKLEANKKPETFGVTPQIIVDDEGNKKILQIGNQGGINISDIPEGFNLMTKGLKKIDMGTYLSFQDPYTGQEVYRESKNLVEAAAQSALGAQQGKEIAGFPEAIATADTTLDLIRDIKNDPDLKNVLGSLQGRVLPETPFAETIIGRGGQRVLANIQSLQGRIFLQAFATLKGGGQITEIEGLKAEKAMARLNRFLSLEDYQNALSELEDVITASKQRAIKGIIVDNPYTGPLGGEYLTTGQNMPTTQNKTVGDNGFKDVGNGVRLRIKPKE
jgi:hypothetical protein